MGENKWKGETSDDYHGGDEPPKVDRARSIFKRGELVGTAMREQGVGQWCQNKRQGYVRGRAGSDFPERNANYGTITHRRGEEANWTIRHTRG